MACRGVCQKYRSKKPTGSGRYEIGQKRCVECELYLDWADIRCPCCKSSLRTKPRKSRNKIRLRRIIETITV